MASARIEQTVRLNAETDYRTDIMDPLPDYPEYAGKLRSGLVSGGLRFDFSYGYATPAEIHAAIARLRDALDRLDIDVDAAMDRQAAATPDPFVDPCFCRDYGTNEDGESDEVPIAHLIGADGCKYAQPLPDGVEFVGTVGQFLDGIESGEAVPA